MPSSVRCSADGIAIDDSEVPLIFEYTHKTLLAFGQRCVGVFRFLI